MAGGRAQPRQQNREELLALARDVLGDEAAAYEELLHDVSDEELLELFETWRQRTHIDQPEGEFVLPSAASVRQSDAERERGHRGHAAPTAAAHTASMGCAEVAALAREILGEQVIEYEDVLRNISLDEFLELFGEHVPGQLLSGLSPQGSAVTPAEPSAGQRSPQAGGAQAHGEECAGQPLCQQGSVQDSSPTRGTEKASKSAEAHLSLSFFCTDDDGDFEGPSRDVRRALEVEVAQLRDSIGRSREAFAQLSLTANVSSVPNSSAFRGDSYSCAAVGEDIDAGANIQEDVDKETEQGISREQANDIAYLEDLMLKNELFHKALLYDLTKLETVDLFEQRGLDAPKDGDFEIVKQLLTQTKAMDAARFREQLRSKGGSRLRFVNNEMVETKSKYLLPKKDSEFIKGTTVALTLLGNSSKARREQRKEDLEATSRRAGPVSNKGAAKKK